jgi:uncharacterized membrane protein YccF (DUF307 family)
MIKDIVEFVMTGIMVVVGYLLYFILASIATVLIGIPIGFGIHIINEMIKTLFNGA